jgi:hypothetical protein
MRGSILGRKFPDGIMTFQYQSWRLFEDYNIAALQVRLRQCGVEAAAMEFDTDLRKLIVVRRSEKSPRNKPWATCRKTGEAASKTAGS